MALFHLPVEVEDLETRREDRLCVTQVLPVETMTEEERSDIVAGLIRYLIAIYYSIYLLPAHTHAHTHKQMKSVVIG